jgi:hypothetical protein
LPSGKPKAVDALELVRQAAASPSLSEAEATIAVTRLVLHYGATDPTKLQAGLGTALGQVLVGLSKVRAAGDPEGGGGLGALVEFVKGGK